MIEREAIYPIITHVGNSVNIEKPIPYLHIKVGGNSDTYDEYRKRELRYKEFLKYQDEWFGDSASIVQYVTKRDWNKVGYLRKSKRSALRFFLRADWKDNFISEVYGTAEEAFWSTNNKEELIEAYIEWFDTRKERMRLEMTSLVDVNRKALVSKTGKPLSHGGIANLLKVLTKTMETQGADITSIAKMQYAICKQAGIYIVDEFIEDVAVVLGREVEE